MATIQIDVDDYKKESLDYLFTTLGLDTVTAVRIFLSASLANDGFPFQVKLGAREPSDEFRETMDDVRLRRNLHGPFDTVAEAMKALLED